MPPMNECEWHVRCASFRAAWGGSLQGGQSRPEKNETKANMTAQHRFSFRLLSFGVLCGWPFQHHRPNRICPALRPLTALSMCTQDYVYTPPYTEIEHMYNPQSSPCPPPIYVTPHSHAPPPMHHQISHRPPPRPAPTACPRPPPPWPRRRRSSWPPAPRPIFFLCLSFSISTHAGTHARTPQPIRSRTAIHRPTFSVTPPASCVVSSTCTRL